MTYTPDPTTVRELAAEIVISHATDIEFMSVGEMIDGDQRIGDIDEDDFDTLQTAIHDMARKATVAVTFSEANDDLDDEPIHGFFGLTRSSYLVLPRVLLQSMPGEWQRKLVPLLEEMQEAFAHVEQAECYDVRSAVEKEAEELTEAEQELTGVFCVNLGGEDVQCRDRYYDRDGNEIECWTRVLVPVADPLPPYRRGRTRVPRADQLPPRPVTVGEAIIALIPGAEGAGVKP